MEIDSLEVSYMIALYKNGIKIPIEAFHIVKFIPLDSLLMKDPIGTIDLIKNKDNQTISIDFQNILDLARREGDFNEYDENENERDSKVTEYLRSLIHEDRSAVFIPYGIVKIPDDCFNHIKQLSSDYISLPETVRILGNRSFRKCAIGHIEIPDNVTEIGEECFYKSYLENVILSNSLIELKPLTFAFCQMKSIVIPEGIIKIDYKCFYRCDHLRNVSLPNSLLTIGDEAFAITDITSITIPPNVVKFGYSVLEKSYIQRHRHCLIRLSKNTIITDTQDKDIFTIEYYD